MSWTVALVVAAYVATGGAAVVAAWRLDASLDRWLLLSEARRLLRGDDGQDR